MLASKTYIDGNGRLALSAHLRKQLNLNKGDQVYIKLTDEGLLISSFQTKLVKARKLLQQYISDDKSLVDELISMRRAEYLLEEAKYTQFKLSEENLNESKE